MGVADATSSERGELPFSAAVLNILRSAERMEVQAVRETDSEPEVTGRGWVADPADRAEFVRQFLAANWWPEGEEMCFDAQYVVRLLAPTGEVELHFCFPCSNVMVVTPDHSGGIIPFERGPNRIVKRLARKVGAVRPWWRFW
jgi:hypothetical protein